MEIQTETEAETGQLIIPKIEPKEGESAKIGKSQLRSLFTVALGTDACARAVAQYKGNGSRCGHKVLDDSKAVDALIDAASKEMANQIEAIKLRQWDRVQVLNQVIRRHWELDKHGKLTGNPSKRALASQTQTATE